MAVPPSPTASFTVSPSRPTVGQSATYTSTSNDLTDPIDQVAWDFDNDGTYETADDTAPFAVSHTFSTSGSKTVGIRVKAGPDPEDVTTATQQVVVNAAPVASFTAPESAPVNTSVEFDADSTTDDQEPPPLPESAYKWDYDGDGFDDDTGSFETNTFTQPGDYDVRLQVTDSDGATDIATKKVTVVGPPANQPPVPSFTVTPASPLVGQTVEFDADATTDDGPLSESSYLWDYDGDGFDDDTGSFETNTFTTAATYIVRLQVTDSAGIARVASRIVTVTDPDNPSPIARFAYFPSQPVAGQLVDFFSTSSDPGGSVTRHLWDFDGDGQCDDASGPTAAYAFPAGTRVVKLCVEDNQGAQNFTTRTISVRESGFVSTGPAAPPPSIGLMSPFPIVRIAGRATRYGARIKRLSVSAPKGSKIVVRCKGGRRCPLKRSATRSLRGRVVRFKRFERRLRAGVVLEVFVSKQGVIGKHTRFKIRRRKAPARRDRCLAYGARRPMTCPES